MASKSRMGEEDQGHKLMSESERKKNDESQWQESWDLISSSSMHRHITKKE